MTKKEPRYNIEALSRGLQVLSLFTAESPSLSLTRISGAMGINKSTVFRILATLETMGYLERDAASRLYRPSLSVLRLGFTAMNGLEVRQIARPYLETLAQEVKETVSLGVMNGTEVIYVDRVRNHAIVGLTLDAGSSLPAHCTTLGKVLLAQRSPEQLEKFFAKVTMKEYTPRTVVDPRALLSELAGVRRNGYALCDGELAVGLRAAGAPVGDDSGKIIAAVNVSGSSLTISLQRLRKQIVPAVVKTAGEISVALGYEPVGRFSGGGTHDKGGATLFPGEIMIR